MGCFVRQLITVRNAGNFSQDPGRGIVDEVSALIRKDPRGGLPQAQINDTEPRAKAAGAG